MMDFKDQKRKNAVIAYFKHIETTILPNEAAEKVATTLADQLKMGYELIEHNEWGIAFENLSTFLVENYLILDRVGIQKVQVVIDHCGLDSNWVHDLRRIKSLGYIEGSWRLTDAEKIAQANKYTFYKPSRKITDQLQAGNFAKLIFEFDSTNEEHPSAERMWVKITERNIDGFKGYLDNDPFFLHELYAGDEITFSHQHIIGHDLEISEPNLVDKYLDRCLVTSKVLYENQSVNYLYREAPMTLTDSKYKDSGWRILAGDESDEYMDQAENTHFVSLGAVLSKDDGFVHLLESPVGSEYGKNQDGLFIKL